MKYWKRKFGLMAFFFLFVFGTLFSRSPTDSEGKVAVVCFLEGKAWVTHPGEKERSEIALFDWIQTEAIIQTDSKSRLILAFSTGDRYELKGNAEATVGEKGFTSHTGPIKILSPVPVMPQIASISKESRPGSRLGGIRLRGSKNIITGLYPSKGATLLADKAILTFEPIEGAIRYRIEIEDEWGNNIFSVETASPKIVVSPGILEPGANYYWQVRTLNKEKPSIFGEAIFATVSEENIKTINAFKEKAHKSKDVANLLLLAQMDIALGLQKEACETLKAALALSPDNSEIKKAMSKIDCK